MGPNAARVGDHGRSQAPGHSVYPLFASSFFVIGGIEAIVIRIQLMRPHNDFVSPQVFNRACSPCTARPMIFFVAMPILFGFGNYLVPLMIERGTWRFRG